MRSRPGRLQERLEDSRTREALGAALRSPEDDRRGRAGGMGDGQDPPRACIASGVGPGWSDVHVHHSLSAADLPTIDLTVDFLGHRLGAPLVIAAMTGGHEAASDVNARLARAAQRHRLAMGLGNQRAALPNPGLARTYAVARQVAPDAFLIANVGAAPSRRRSINP